MKKIILIIVIFILLFTACQPTPEAPVVANKGDGTYEEIISDVVAQGEKFEYSDWNETYELQGATAVIHPEIVMGEGSTYPVKRVVRDTFDVSLIREIVDVIAPNITEYHENTPTKDDYTQYLLMSKRGMYLTDDNGSRWEAYNGQEEDNLSTTIRFQII